MVREEELIGYLLNALDQAERREVEAYLDSHPEGQRQLDLLRQALLPLAADREDFEPPADLASRTLARVAELRRRDLPHIAPRTGGLAPPSRRWRRPDLLVAAALLLCAVLLVPEGIHKLRIQQRKYGCQDNLRQIGDALTIYSKVNKGDFPNVTRAFDAPDDSPRSAAGLFVPMLVDSGALSPDRISVFCPADDTPRGCTWTLAQLRQMSPEEFRRHAPELVPSYAYTLGYQDAGQVQGLRRQDGLVPIAADAPPFNGPEPTELLPGNSLNHGGLGQNVLFTDGHVKFLKVRTLGQDDDIYTNQDNRIAAGKHRFDHVLGPSGACP